MVHRQILINYIAQKCIPILDEKNVISYLAITKPILFNSEFIKSIIFPWKNKHTKFTQFYLGFKYTHVKTCFAY